MGGGGALGESASEEGQSRLVSQNKSLHPQIHANCRIRRVYFSDRLYSEDELPAEFKLYLPVQNKAKVSRPSSEDRAVGRGSGGLEIALRAEPQSLCVDENCGEAFHLHRRPQAFPTCSAEPGTICQVSRYCSLHLHKMSPPRLRGGRLFSPAHRPSAGASFSAPRGLQPMGLPRPSGGCSMPASC